MAAGRAGQFLRHRLDHCLVQGALSKKLLTGSDNPVRIIDELLLGQGIGWGSKTGQCFKFSWSF